MRVVFYNNYRDGNGDFLLWMCVCVCVSFLFPQHATRNGMFALPANVNEINSVVCGNLSREVKSPSWGRCINDTGPSVYFVGVMQSHKHCVLHTSLIPAFCVCLVWVKKRELWGTRCSDRDRMCFMQSHKRCVLHTPPIPAFWVGVCGFVKLEWLPKSWWGLGQTSGLYN